MILGILWLAYHNPEIDWRIGEVKIIRCLKECKSRRNKKKTTEIKKVTEEWKI